MPIVNQEPAPTLTPSPEASTVTEDTQAPTFQSPELISPIAKPVPTAFAEAAATLQTPEPVASAPLPEAQPAATPEPRHLSTFLGGVEGATKPATTSSPEPIAPPFAPQPEALTTNFAAPVVEPAPVANQQAGGIGGFLKGLFGR